MSHNLDITNGQASFVSAREDAWHHLGTVLPAAFTAEDAMVHGHLGGWNVRKAPLFAEVGECRLEIPNRYAVVRDNPIVPDQIDVLGNVGEAYRILQNEDLAGLLDALVDESGANFQTAGAIDGGRKVFVTLKLPGGVRIGGADPVDNYIAAMTSHDGSSSTTLMVTPVRIVCQNTMNLAFQNSTNQFRIRHTSGANKILLQQAREALEFTFNYLDGFQEEAEQLINTTLTQGQFEALIEREFGAPADAPTVTRTRADNKLAEMAELFSDSFTHAGVRQTAWAGLNALTEWHDHFSPVRGAAPGQDQAVRSRKALLDPGFKNDALKLILAAV